MASGPSRTLDAGIVLLGVVALVGLGPLRPAFAGAPLVPFLCVLCLFMVPGAVLVSRSFCDLPGPVAVPASFAVSVGIFALLGVPFLAMNLGLEPYIWRARPLSAPERTGGGRGRQLRLLAQATAAGSCAPWRPVSGFVQTHARVYLEDSEVVAELWERPRPAPRRLRAAERLAVLGRLPAQPAADAPPRVSARGTPRRDR